MEAGVKLLLAGVVPILRGGMDADQAGFCGECLIDLIQQRRLANAPFT